MMMALFAFVISDEGKIYKIVQWRDIEGEMRSELIDILEGTYPEPVRAMDISSMVREQAEVRESQYTR